jgi:hypothetical protein
MGFDASDVYASSLLALASAAVGVIFVRRAWAWRVELAGLIGVSVLWAGFLVIILRSNAVGGDCSEPHHEGELPMLVVTLVWTAALAVALHRFPAEPRIRVRLVPALGTATVVIATVYVLLTFRPAC